MLQLRVFGERPAMEALAARLGEFDGAHHVILAGDGNGDRHAVVTADVDAAIADGVLEATSALGVEARDMALLRIEAIQPGKAARGDVVWADLLGLAAQYSHVGTRFLIFMGVAGVIAAYGVIFANGILIVGAMAVSPDLLPVAATCIGITLWRPRLIRRATVALAAGLALAALVAGLLTSALIASGLVPSEFNADPGVLAGLTTVNSSTFLVALVAGVAAMLALETRASAAVGVAISVTTIPASAYIGVAAGVGQTGKATGAVAVLGINVACLITSGTLTLVAQRALNR